MRETAAPREARVENPRDSGLDVVRVVAILLVVCIHCNSSYYFSPKTGVYGGDWVVASLLASSGRICVPLFFMLSGCLLLKPGLNPLQFYRKRLSRIFVPLLFWSFVYIVVRKTLEANQISALSACRLFYNGEIYYHLWFLYALIGLYLVIPFLSPLAEAGRDLHLLGFAGLTFILGSLLPCGDRLLTEVGGFPFRLGIYSQVF